MIQACKSRRSPSHASGRPLLLMDIESLRTTVVDFVRHHEGWAPLVVAVLAFGESLAFLSLLFPATVLLVAIGAVAGGMGLGFWPIWIGAAVGASLGDWLSYEVGRYFEH